MVRISEWTGPTVLAVRPGYVLTVVGRKGVMEIGDGSNVPRVTCQGACKEGVGVVEEVRNNRCHKFLRKLGDWGPARGRRLRGASIEQVLDFGRASGTNVF